MFISSCINYQTESIKYWENSSENLSTRLVFQLILRTLLTVCWNRYEKRSYLKDLRFFDYQGETNRSLRWIRGSFWPTQWSTTIMSRQKWQVEGGQLRDLQKNKADLIYRIEKRMGTVILDKPNNIGKREFSENDWFNFGGVNSE